MSSKILLANHDGTLSDVTWAAVADRIAADLAPPNRGPISPAEAGLATAPESATTSPPPPHPAATSATSDDMRRVTSEALSELADLQNDVGRSRDKPAAQRAAFTALEQYLASLRQRFPDPASHTSELRGAIHEMEDARDILAARVREAATAEARRGESDAITDPDLDLDDPDRLAEIDEAESAMHASDAQAEIHVIQSFEQRLARWQKVARTPEREVRTALAEAETQMKSLRESYPVGATGREYHQEAFARLESVLKRLHNLLPPGSRWVDGVAGFATGMVQFEEGGRVSDELDLTPFATRFARVIALRDTELPLSVGLFGEWGSGKTYFMKLLRQEIGILVAQKEGPWCREVAPIRFNAWHYVDTNLWASLVTEIFDQLFDYLAGEKATPEQRKAAAEKVMRKLEHAKGAVAGAEEELAGVREQARHAKATLRRAEKQAVRAAEKRTAALSFIDGALDRLTELLPEAAQNEGWQEAIETLGLGSVDGSLKDLETRVSDLRSLGGRLRALGLEILSKAGRKERLWHLAGAVVAAPVGMAAIGAAMTFWNERLQPAGLVTGQLTGLISGVALWLRGQTRRAGEQLSQAEAMVKAAQQKRRKKAEEPEVLAAKKRATVYKQIEERARETLKEARAKMRRLEEELNELRPERRLFKFIEERARARDYREHLGLVSLVRRDFRELSRLFLETAEAVRAGEKPSSPSQKRIDRIVLFVDDLDRCQPDRVVAVLEAVHLLLDFPLFVAVVAVDPRWVKRSLRAHYARLLGNDDAARTEPQARREDPEPPSREEERQATPLDYLEKIFHIPFHLPPMQRKGFEKLIGTLAGEIEEAHAPEPAEIPPEPPVDAPPAPEAVSAPAPGSARPAETPDDSPFESAEARAKAKPLGIVKLEPWELTELHRYAALIRTPRAAKRLLNTYRLVRAGLSPEEWEKFRANDGDSGECRAAMLLLATAAGFPGIAREWFHDLALRNGPPQTTTRFGASPSGPEWQEFVKTLSSQQKDAQMDRLEWPPAIEPERLRVWLARVERFAF